MCKSHVWVRVPSILVDVGSKGGEGAKDYEAFSSINTNRNKK
jgi:hypothetical protein